MKKHRLHGGKARLKDKKYAKRKKEKRYKANDCNIKTNDSPLYKRIWACGSPSLEQCDSGNRQ